MASVATVQLRHVAVVDDNRDYRDELCKELSDFQFRGHPLEGTYRTVSELVNEAQRVAKAGLFDYKLSQGNYASFNGAEAAREAYSRQFPTVLITRYARVDLNDIRRFRRWIPYLLQQDQLQRDALDTGFQRCLREFRGDFDPSRKPWKELVRVQEVFASEQPATFDVVVPAWSYHQIIRLNLSDVPRRLRPQIEPGFRFLALVNTGSEDPDELYVDMIAPKES